MAAGGSKAWAVLVYTVLRVAVFLGVWLTIELLTPISGIWAIVIAILLSGAISLILLDRPRNRVGAVAAGFFGGINERIEASARAEDDEEPPAVPPQASADGQGQAQHDPVDEK